MAKLNNTSRLELVFERQWLHLIGLCGLIGAIAGLADRADVSAGFLWGLGTPTWIRLAVGLAVAHQVYVWIAWRGELHLGALTHLLGSRAFGVYACGFTLLGIARVLAAALVGVANQGTLAGPSLLWQLLGTLAFVPSAYLFHSVRRHFGFRRAFGIDHFDAASRDAPFVRRGIFRHSSNAMYVFGFLLFWALALWTCSVAALAVAAFNHAYIWVHFYATELPDIHRMYKAAGRDGAQAAG